MDSRVNFYSCNSNLLLVPADKAANNIIVIGHIHYLNVLQNELNGTNAYSKSLTSEQDLVKHHVTQISNFKLKINEKGLNLPTIYWIHKLHKNILLSSFYC